MLDLIVGPGHNGTCVRRKADRHLLAYAFPRPNRLVHLAIDKSLSPTDRDLIRLILAHALDLDEQLDDPRSASIIRLDHLTDAPRTSDGCASVTLR